MESAGTFTSDIWHQLELDGKSAFGILFSPGNTKHADSKSFEVLEELKELSGGLLPIIGGSCADDWHMEQNYVLFGARAYPDSVLVAVFETQLKIGMGLSHGFKPTSNTAVVTKSEGHEVLQLDNRPAAEVYSELTGYSEEELIRAIQHQSGLLFYQAKGDQIFPANDGGHPLSNYGTR